MVEGPKVVMKVKRIYSLKGQVLQAMIVMPTQSSSQPLTGPMSECIGMTVQEIWCLGKELFLNMTDPSVINGKIIGIKLHFGMAGSERLINTSTMSPGHHVQNLSIVAKSMLPNGSRKKWTTCLIFNQQALFTYDSTITTKTANYLEKAFDSLHLDVMSYDKFNPDSVIRHIRAADQSRHIHEVIMDQSILPGVGNVIKIEGLIDARIHPHSITRELNDERLKHLIKKLKDYARY
jgi:formamidopyrimidine-DNA glycosylase